MGIDTNFRMAQAPAPPAETPPATTQAPVRWNEFLESDGDDAVRIYNYFWSIFSFWRDNKSRAVPVFSPPGIKTHLIVAQGPSKEKIKIFRTIKYDENDVPIERYKIVRFKNGVDIASILIFERTNYDEEDPGGIKDCSITKTYIKMLGKKDGVQEVETNTRAIEVTFDEVTQEADIAVLDSKDIEEEQISAEIKRIEESIEIPAEREAAIEEFRRKVLASRGKKEPIETFQGYRMRSSMASKMRKIEEIADKMMWKIQVTSSMDGVHSSWNHGAGYAADFIFYRDRIDDKGKRYREYINSYDWARIDEEGVLCVIDQKYVKSLTQEELILLGIDKASKVFVAEFIRVLNDSGDFNVDFYNEYEKDSRYKTGSHIHVSMDPSKKP